MSDGQLISNLHNQVSRLVKQLEELEQEKDALTEEEYNEMKNETVEELNEISQTLEKMSGGELSVTASGAKEKQAILNAIAAAFQSIHGDQSPNKKRIALLRQKLIQVGNDYSLKKIDDETFKIRKAAVLSRLSELGDHLSTEESLVLKESLSDINLSLQSASSNSKAKDEFIDSL
ncbi:hypothetical protein PENTCL1PPCAC_6837 [Pristionchus entomophagus]|uniref:Uncharacterized protein n=1 Tax=Pristionchus entomophagus TaxID=358040 RepID=A0AAV5SQ82_9BILA|nr:hypothetical protein PENTCL1PPCAC_6837 [Pristionchus entomophagus]